MESLHDVDAWLAEIAKRPSVFNHNLRLRAGEFKGYALVNEAVLTGSNGAAEHVYIYALRNAATETLLRVSVTEHPDARHALLAMAEALDHCMNPEVARAGGKLGRLADLGFTAQGEGGKGLGLALLSVGNVALSLRSAGKGAADVAAPAEHVGKMLSTPPAKGAQREGQAAALPPPKVELRAGEVLTLIEHLPATGPGAERIQVIAPEGGELRREGDALVYVSTVRGSPRIEGYTHSQGEAHGE